MTESASRPPWIAVALFLVATFGVGGWIMAHAYDTHAPGPCAGERYAAARTAADSAALDRFVPDSERSLPQPHSCAMLAPPTPAGFAQADSLLTRAIVATGGDSALTHLQALEWDATVTAGDPAGAKTGLWRLAPPDTEVEATWGPGDSATTTHRVVVMGGSVWAESNGDSVSLTPEERSAERHRAYLFALLRLLPIREPGARFWPLPTDSAGRPGLLVRTPGRLDVALYFGGDGRVEVIRTTVIPAPGSPPSTTTVTLSGLTEIAGVHWFREMEVERDGRKELDLTITAARPATSPTSGWLTDSTGR